MALVIGTNAGGQFLASQLSTRESRYSPVYDTELPTTSIWNVLPDFYKLMDDRDVMEAVWTGTLQVLSAELLNLWQADYGKSLRDVPVLSQRKWVRFDFVKEETFAADPELDVVGLPGRFAYDSTNKLFNGSWTNRGGVDKATVALNGTATEQASLAWSVTLTPASVQAGGCLLVGYLSADSRNRLTNALLVGLIGAEGAADTPYPILLQVSSAGAMTFVRAGTALAVGTEYRLDCQYVARTGVVSLSVIEIGAEKLSGSTGKTAADDDEDTYTDEFTDSGADFSGVVAGDVLTIEGTSYTIREVDGSTLLTEFAQMPAGASGLAYTITGEVIAFSLSLDLPNEAGDGTFSVTQFGATTLDTRLAPTALGTASGLNRKRALALVSAWTYTDPTTAEVVLKCPRLQDAVVSPSSYLYEGTDYTLVSSTFQFQEPPVASYWAEYAGFDEGVLQDNFGTNVELEEESSEAYKSRVRGLYYAYYRGPTVNAIRTGVHILIGLPIADAAGTVESINPSYSGDYGQIVVAGTGYLYPRSVGTSLDVGDEVAMFQPLSDGVEIKDYVNSPRWWSTISDPELDGTMREIRKYHSFAVFLNMDAFDLSTLVEAAAFVNVVKPTWKDPYFVVYKEVADDLDLDDALGLTVTLCLWDTIPATPIVRYDSDDFEGAALDWRIDQGFAEPDDLDDVWTGAAIRQTATALGGVVTVTVGDAAVVGSGTAFLTDLGAGQLGSITDVGVSGATDATGLIFTGDGTESFTTSIPYDVGTGEVRYSTVLTLDVGGPLPLLARVIEVTDDLTLVIEPLYPTAVGDFQSLSGCTYGVSQMTVALALGRYFAGTAGTTTAGLQALTEMGAFAGVVVGAPVSVEGLTCQAQVVTNDEITLSKDALTTQGGDATWQVRNPLYYWAWVAYVIDDEHAVLAVAPTSGALVGDVLYHAALVDPAYLRVYADQFDEAVPEETLTFVHEISAGYQETLLTGTVAFETGSASVLGAGTDFVAEIGGPGVVPAGTKFVVAPDGVWYEVAQVVSGTELLLTFEASADFAAARLYLAHQVLSGTFDFTNGSATVTCSSDQRGAIAVGDWVQVVPVQDGHVTTSNPVVQVDAINPLTGLDLTLVDAYSGATVLGQAAIWRADSTALPLVISTALGNQAFVNWRGTPGGRASADVPERVP